jgi:hypothetical protein
MSFTGDALFVTFIMTALNTSFNSNVLEQTPLYFFFGLVRRGVS